MYIGTISPLSLFTITNKVLKTIYRTILKITARDLLNSTAFRLLFISLTYIVTNYIGLNINSFLRVIGLFLFCMFLLYINSKEIYRFYTCKNKLDAYLDVLVEYLTRYILLLETVNFIIIIFAFIVFDLDFFILYLSGILIEYIVNMDP
jgi:hypothetical protein